MPALVQTVSLAISCTLIHTIPNTFFKRSTPYWSTLMLLLIDGGTRFELMLTLRGLAIRGLRLRNLGVLGWAT